jgi:hypothetical protein
MDKIHLASGSAHLFVNNKQTTYYSVFKDQAWKQLEPPGKLALYKRGDTKGQDKKEISILKYDEKMILLLFWIGIRLNGFHRFFLNRRVLTF